MTASFRGRYSLRLDPKGRFALPALLRDQTKSKKFFLTNNIHNGRKYLDVFPEKAWLEFEQKISRMPSLNADVQAFRRFYLASAVPVECDKNGRLLVPQELRDYAGLGEDIVILGVGAKFEVWAAVEWGALQNEIIGNYDSILAAVAKLEEDTDDEGRRS